MFDTFFKNLHYFKFDNNQLIFNNKNYYLDELPKEKENQFVIDLYNDEETQELIQTFIYEIYKDLTLTWGKGQGYDGAKKYIDRVAYVEYYDERLKELRRVTIKNYRFYDEKEDKEFIQHLETNLYDLIYA